MHNEKVLGSKRKEGRIHTEGNGLKRVGEQDQGQEQVQFLGKST